MLPSSRQTDTFLERGFTRRQIGRMASVLTAGTALPFYNEFAMAQEAEGRTMRGRGRCPRWCRAE